MLYVHRQRGFALVEILVGIGVFLLFSVGIYSSIQLVFKLVYQSRLRAIETAILNEQIEIIRNLPYESVGIVSSTPAGILERNAAIARNGISFTVTRTVRNVDDPFDGTIGGSPNDTAPADYKFIQVSVVCDACTQEAPMFLASTLVPPSLESAGDTGALFISVSDASAAPVAGAIVRIVSTSTNPAIELTDTTDSAGMYKAVSLPAGDRAYAVWVAKPGYTFDTTRMPSSSNPNPVKLPMSVVKGAVVQGSFTIDRASTVTLRTLDGTCAALPAVPVSFSGARLVGTDPDVFRVDDDIVTDGSGISVSTTIPWDIYAGSPAGYDLLGTIPGLPVSVLPGVSAPIDFILGSSTAHSILVHVRDRASLLPVHGASVGVTSTMFSAATSTPASPEGCTPPGQAYFGGMNEDTYTVTVSKEGYQTVVETIPVSGHGNVMIELTSQ